MAKKKKQQKKKQQQRKPKQQKKSRSQKSITGTKFKRQLFNPSVNKYVLFNELKAKNNYDSFNRTIASCSSHPAIRNYLFAEALPKTYNDIRQSRLIPNSKNLEGELAWNIFAIKKHSQEINKFISLKQEFEEAFLLCEFSLADELLNDIEQSICKSLWSIENRFLLAEYKDGIESNWEMQSDLAKTVKEPIVLFFIDHFSKRAEIRTSYFRYQNLFENQINLDKNQILGSVYEYLYFRLNYPEYIGYESFPLFLTVESTSSIVDRYMLLRDVIFEILGGGDETEVNIIKKIIPDILNIITSDNTLKQINNYITPDNLIMVGDSVEFLDLLDIYTRGEFDVCLEKIPQLLEEFPTAIEFYEIYTKSLLEINKDFIPTNVSPIIDETMLNLYRLYSQSTQTEDAKEKLFKVVLAFYSCGWAKQLFSLVNHQVNVNSEYVPHKLLYPVYSRFNNPRILNFYSDNEDLSKVSEFFFQQFGQNKAICVNEMISKSLLEALISDTEIYDNKKSLYIGRILIKLNKYEDAKKHYENLLKFSELQLPTTSYEEVINNLFISYIKLNEYRQATILFVDSYLHNQYLVTRFNKQGLLNVLEKNSCAGLEDAIDLPIFYKVASFDSYSQYVAYDIFISEHSIEKPMQLFDLSNKFEQKKYIYFLREVCTSEILHHSIFFEGSDDIENERILILKELLKIDKENEDLYIEELTEISKKTAIRKTIREVNKGRIFVNIQQLKSIEASNIKEGFNRYKELENYSQDKGLVAIDPSLELISNYLKLIEEEQKDEGSIDDPAYISFKVMFLELRDKFLHSKECGLDACLSTRIRHGTLANHIRSVFESLNLVSRKDKSGEYHDIDYWDIRIPYSVHNKRNKIQVILKEFSQEIDALIERIIKEHIQIYTEKHTSKPDALFNYAFPRKYLKLLFFDVKNIQEHNKFLDYSFKVLEDFTNIHLEKVRSFFRKELKDSFLTIISNLDSDIKKVIGDTPFVDLTTSIMTCSTNIQNELDNISEWFDFSNPSIDHPLAVETLIQTSVEITNSIYPNDQLSPMIEDVDENIRFTSVNFIYIMRNLLDNIIIHSEIPSEELHVEIKFKHIKDNILRLTIINNISENVDQIQLNSILKETQETWHAQKDDFDRINVEGGSGFDKIRRILLVDMGCKKPDFNYLIEDDFLSILIDMDPPIQWLES